MMKNKILIHNVAFWREQNVIYCKINGDFEEKSLGRDIDTGFFCAISTLSDGKYMPILINMEDVNFSLSIKMFNFLSKNPLIKELVLSKTFLINSIVLRILFSICNFINNPILPDTIFMNYNSAIEYCNEKYKSFNALR